MEIKLGAENSSPYILLLRHEKAAAQSAIALEKNGFACVQMPISRIKYIHSALPEKPFDSIILSSPAAIPALQAHQNWELYKSKMSPLNLYCVGEKTAALAQGAGFKSPHFVASHAIELNRHLVDHTKINCVLYPCAKDRSFNFKNNLEKIDISCEEWEIYTNELLDPGLDKIVMALNNIAVILFYSARTTKHFFHLIEHYDLNSLLNHLSIVAISDKVGAQIPRNLEANTYIADRRDENSMLAVLETICC